MYIYIIKLGFYYFEIYVWQFPTYTAIYEEPLVLSGLKNTFLLKLVKPPLLLKYPVVVLWSEDFRKQRCTQRVLYINLYGEKIFRATVWENIPRP